MKRYKFELTVTEGSDDFWDKINDENRSGCDEILDEVKNMLRDNPQLDAKVKLVEYTDKD